MKQCNYIVSYVNGAKVFTSKKSGKVLTGAAKLACERAEAERAAQEQAYIDNAVENAFIMAWYNENADFIIAEQRATQAECKRIREAVVYGEGFVMSNTGHAIIWPTENGNGFTRGTMHIFLKRVRAMRHAINARREANIKRTKASRDTTSGAIASRKLTTRAVDYVARRILGAKAIREGKRVKFVFTRKIYTLRSFAWQGLPPRACGKIGVVKTDNGLYAWAFAGVVNRLPIWLITKVYAGLNFPIVLDITTKGGDDNPPQGSQPSNDEADEAEMNTDAEYQAFCDKLDEIIHDKKEETPKRVAITGWALTPTMIRTIESAYEDEDVKEALTHTYKKFITPFIRHALACLGWKYNAQRGTKRNAVIDFLRKRDDEKFPIFSGERYDLISTFSAMMAVSRCMKYAHEHSTQAVVIRKEIRAPLARLCRKLILGIIQAQNDEAIDE